MLNYTSEIRHAMPPQFPLETDIVRKFNTTVHNELSKQPASKFNVPQRVAPRSPFNLLFPPSSVSAKHVELLSVGWERIILDEAHQVCERAQFHITFKVD